MIQAIVFDFDGVIADTEPLHYRAFLRAFEPVGITFDYDTYMQHYIGCDDRDGIRLAFTHHQKPLTDDLMRELIATKSVAFGDVVREGVSVYPGVVELISDAGKVMPLAICSGALLADIQAIMPAVGDGTLLDRFSAIVTADDVAQSKPDPTSYRLAAERLGLAPDACVAIEDTPAGLASAKGAGMKTIAVTNTHPANDLAADWVVKSLTEVTVSSMRQRF